MRREHGSDENKTSETGEKIAGFEHDQSENDKSESENRPANRVGAKQPRRNRGPNGASSQAKSSHSNGVAEGVANGVGDGAKAVRDAVGSAGKEAGHAVSKAKIPLLAGGAAVAGTVGGLVLGASRSGDKVLGVSSQVQAGQAEVAGLLESGEGSRPLWRERRRTDDRAEARPRGSRKR